jgi:16S rRNA (guanine966-N2)-methyltransferase
VIRRGRPSRVRIIGGAWRRRWLPVAPVPGLRPSADAQRETLFNWLQPGLPGATVLDLFAGTGALGLEAASRGAHSVLLVEKSPVAARQLEANCRLLGAAQVTVRQDDALRLLAQGREAAGLDPFDLVFVDPPFEKGLVAPVLERCWAAAGWPPMRVSTWSRRAGCPCRPAGRSCASGPGAGPGFPARQAPGSAVTASGGPATNRP